MLISLLATSLSMAPPQAAQPVTLEAAPVTRSAHFGEAMAIDGPLAVISAPLDQISASESGSVRIYRMNGAHWDLEHVVLATEPRWLGFQVDIDGERVAIPRYSSSSFHPADEVKIFDLIGGQWMETASITCSDPTVGGFGFDVALDGDRLAVVATFQGVVSSNATFAANQLFIYDKVGGSWVESARLRPAPDPISGDDPYSSPLLGKVDLVGDRVVLGAANSTVGGLAYVGLVSIFERNAGGTWVETVQLAPSSPNVGEGFGASLVLNGDSLFVGAPGNDAHGVRAGSVEVFEYAGGTWGQTQTLAQPMPTAGAEFGSALAADANQVVAGIRPYNFDLSAQEADRVETFARDPFGSFVHVGTLEEPHRHYRRTFGASLAIDGRALLVGAPGSLSHGENRGAAYAYGSLVDTVAISQLVCPGGSCACPPPAGTSWAGCENGYRKYGKLTAGGSISIADDTLELITVDIPQGSVVYLLAANGLGPATAFGGGNLCISDDIVLSIQQAGNGGVVSEPRGIASRIGGSTGATGPVLPGETWTFQVSYRDPAWRARRRCNSQGFEPFVGDPRFNATNAVSVTFLP
jgi:hypothetical protein